MKRRVSKRRQAMSDICLECHLVVRPLQEAIQCDKCDRWQHRKCILGISRDRYRELKKEVDGFEWTCTECSGPFELDNRFMQENMPEFNSIDVDAAGHRHLLLYTDHQLELLGKAKTWYMDATFRVVNRPWMQLFTINSFIRSGIHMKQVPLMYCFMSSKRKADYYEVLRTVDHLLPDQIKLQSFVVDFEAALWRALQDRLPAYTIQECVFHYTQAVYRKVQELGLQRAYNERGDVFSFISVWAYHRVNGRDCS